MAQPATRTNWWGGQERVDPVAPRWQTPPPASGGQQQPNASAGQSPTPKQQGGDYSAYRPQQGGYSAYNPGQAQPTQQPAMGTAYNPQQASPYPYGGQPQAPPFQFRATDFMGNQFNNPGDFTSQQGAMVQALNQQRAQQLGDMFTQGTPMGSLDPFAAYGQGQQMLQDGFQNPFAPPGMGQQPGMGPPQTFGPLAPERAFYEGPQPGLGHVHGRLVQSQPGGQFQDLFQQFGFAPPPGFMDALIQRLGGQPPAQDPAPQRPGQAQPDTTMAMGEEGSPQRPGQAQPVQQPTQGTPMSPPGYKTTMAMIPSEMGDPGPQRPGQAQPGFTTMAMGEEGSPQRPGQAQPGFTTMAHGEEGSPQQPPGQAQPVQPPSQGTPYQPDETPAAPLFPGQGRNVKTKEPKVYPPEEARAIAWRNYQEAEAKKEQERIRQSQTPQALQKRLDDLYRAAGQVQDPVTKQWRGTGKGSKETPAKLAAFDAAYTKAFQTQAKSMPRRPGEENNLSPVEKEIARMEAWKSLEGMSKKQLQAMTKPKKKR